MTIYDLLIPMLVIMAPALLVYAQLKTQTGLMCGLIVGIVLCVGAELIPTWTIVFAVLVLSATIYSNVRGR